MKILTRMLMTTPTLLNFACVPAQSGPSGNVGVGDAQAATDGQISGDSGSDVTLSLFWDT